MLPAGGPTEETVTALGGLLEKGDVVIDGGNSFYRDDIRRAKALKAKGHRLRGRRHLAAASGGWSAAIA